MPNYAPKSGSKRFRRRTLENFFDASDKNLRYWGLQLAKIYVMLEGWCDAWTCILSKNFLYFDCFELLLCYTVPCMSHSSLHKHIPYLRKPFPKIESPYLCRKEPSIVSETVVRHQDDATSLLSQKVDECVHSKSGRSCRDFFSLVVEVTLHNCKLRHLRCLRWYHWKKQRTKVSYPRSTKKIFSGR